MSNIVWKFNSKSGMAYLESKDLVDTVLKLAGEQVSSGGVAATYYSPGGKPFAWQVCFNIDQMHRVSSYLGLEPARIKPDAKKTAASKKVLSAARPADARKPVKTKVLPLKGRARAARKP